MGLPAVLTPGTIIGGHYIIDALINSGGFGSVYRGTDTSEGKRPCAIKEIYHVTPAVRRQALMEASVLLTIRSKHLPDVYDALEFNNRFYLVMELIEGQNLLQLLRSRVPGGLVGEQLPHRQGQGPCSEQEVLDWLLPVMDVLQELHGRNPPIMHRDIKPGNIILQPNQTAVLVDFGLSKLYDPSRSTQTMLKAVSEGFSPLEQYVGKTSPQSDIYSMAATIYLLLTNRRPPLAVDRSTRDTLISPRQLNSSLSPKVERVLLKALAVEADQRYHSMREFSQALQDPAFDAYSDPTIANPPVGSYRQGQQNSHIVSAPPIPPRQYTGRQPTPVPQSYQGVLRPPGGILNGGVAALYPYGPSSLPGYSLAPQLMAAPLHPLPTVFGEGCLWGLLQGVLAGLLVAFTQDPINFYLAVLMGLCFYVIAGLATTHRGGSPWRGFWAGCWTGICSTVIFWFVYGVGFVIRLSQRLRYESYPISSGRIFNRTIHSVQTALPSLPPSHSSPNLLVLLSGGLLLASLLGLLGGMLGRSWHRARMQRKKQSATKP